MEILFVASEAFPLVKVGGLGDVTSSLSTALGELGHKPLLVLPRYASARIPVEGVQVGDFAVDLMGHREPVTLKMTTLRGKIPVYLVENQHYFGAQAIYDRDELRRFLFFSLTVPTIISQLGLRPDIVHCHDWHTALVPLWLRRANMKPPCIFTIHNLAYQGSFDQQFLLASGLSSVWQEYVPAGAPRPPLSFMSQGILLADIVTTVSSTYASEILTPQYGEGLEQLLDYRRDDLHGIVNGIDYNEYNPATDPYLESNYDTTTLERRVDNKLVLQGRTGLPRNPDVPLFGMVSRLEEQKGIDLLLGGLDSFITETRAQLAILGEGRGHYETLLAEAALRHPERVAVIIASDERLAHLIYGGCDAFLMPSRFEPCGLGQLIAMRYGAIPVVRRTGGLTDTVRDVTESNGNGFVFRGYATLDMLGAMRRAEESFHQREEWRSLMEHNMKLDLSWKVPAGRYEKIYLQARKMPRL